VKEEQLQAAQQEIIDLKAHIQRLYESEQSAAQQSPYSTPLVSGENISNAGIDAAAAPSTPQGSSGITSKADEEHGAERAIPSSAAQAIQCAAALAAGPSAERDSAWKRCIAGLEAALLEQIAECDVWRRHPVSVLNPAYSFTASRADAAVSHV